MKIFVLFLISLAASKLTLYGGEKPADPVCLSGPSGRGLQVRLTFHPELCFTQDGRWGQLNLAKCDYLMRQELYVCAERKFQSIRTQDKQLCLTPTKKDLD